MKSHKKLTERIEENKISTTNATPVTACMCVCVVYT